MGAGDIHCGMRLRHRLAALIAALVAAGTAFLGAAGPAAALPPPPPTVPVTQPCFVNPGLCFSYEGDSTFTAWSLYDVGPTPYYYTIWNVSTGHQLAVCGYGTSCTVKAEPVDMPTGRCYAYAAYIGGKNYAIPPTPTVRTARLLQVCG